MRIIRSFFLLSCCLACVLGCKKSNPHTSNACRIVASYDTLFLPSGIETASTLLFYDNDGRVAYTQSNTPGLSITRVFIHHDSAVVITPTDQRSPTDTIIINSKGMPVQIKNTFVSNDYYDLANYTYDAAGLLQSIAYVQASTSGANRRTATTTYKFVNGDCVSDTYTDATASSTTNFTYYTDRPAADGDYQSFQSIAEYGMVIIRNKHLLRSSQSGSYVSEYNYTFDNSGKIATATYRYNNQVFRNTYVYDCSQQ